jgi:hypothetical protein
MKKQLYTLAILAMAASTSGCAIYGEALAKSRSPQWNAERAGYKAEEAQRRLDNYCRKHKC